MEFFVKKEINMFTSLKVFGLWLFILCNYSFLLAQPQTPVVIEPPVDGYIISPFGLHMVTQAMSDPTPGTHHVATDWEIHQASDSQRVWHAWGVTDVTKKIHIH